jgi:hypothetical protein
MAALTLGVIGLFSFLLNCVPRTLMVLFCVITFTILFVAETGFQHHRREKEVTVGENGENNENSGTKDLVESLSPNPLIRDIELGSITTYGTPSKSKAYWAKARAKYASTKYQDTGENLKLRSANKFGL